MCFVKLQSALGMYAYHDVGGNMFIDYQYKEGNVFGIYDLPRYWAVNPFDHLIAPKDRSLIHMLEFWE